MPAKASSDVTADATAGRKRARESRPVARRSRGFFASVPLVLVSTIAMTLNLALPADAATILKKPLKIKSNDLRESPPNQKNGTAFPARGPLVRASSARSAPGTYVVVEGDTISGIAGRFGLSTASVLAINGLGWSALIFPGQVLTLNNGAAPATPATAPVSSEITRYTIRSGDTIGGIAEAHGLSTSALLSANGLDRSSIIFPGQTVVLPGTPDAAAASMQTTGDGSALASGSSMHTITTGDTISSVAAAAGVSVQAILDANSLGWSSIIYPGQVLAVPGSVPSAPAETARVLPIATAGVVTPLTEEMRGNAAIIVSVGRSAGVNDAGLVIALAAAGQESGLRNVDHGDRDSLGLFQQRPSAGWGSIEEVMDPVRASRAFFGGSGNPNPGVTRGLLDVPGWETMSVTQVAQAVQVSAYPNHYAKWETSARAWLAELG